jgi:hypothetical protein
MIRVSVLVWTIILAFLGIGLFQVKYNVQAKERELRDVRRQIEANLTSIHVLEAEWSYLNDPLRLADLARRHTDLVPTTPAQIGDVASLPARPLPDPLAPLVPETPAEPTPPLISSAPEAAPSESGPDAVPAAAAAPAEPATSIIPVKAAEPEAPVIEPAPVAKAEPKPLKPKDEAAEADAMIDAILADMEKAQGTESANGQAGGTQ